MVVCNGTDGKVWPEKIGTKDTVEYALGKFIKKSGVPDPVLLTLGDMEPEEVEDASKKPCDVFIFPAAVKYA